MFCITSLYRLEAIASRLEAIAIRFLKVFVQGTVVFEFNALRV